jgi:excisionase family DNA binding protein
MEALLKVKEAAKVLSISPSTLYDWVAQGVVPYVRIGGTIRFKPSELQAWIDAGSA